MQITTVSSERHGNKAWQKPMNYSFAAQMAWLPLTAAEMPKAALAAPIGFMQTERGFMPILLMGLEPKKNLFVTHNGQWLCDYYPISLRHYPFQLGISNDEQALLCVDEASGLLSEVPTDGTLTQGEPLFNAQGQPTPALQAILDELMVHEDNRLKTLASCAIINDHELFEPWPITTRKEDTVQRLEGVYRINERRLKGLKAHALEALNAVDALALAYCQLISTQKLDTLIVLVNAHAVVDKRTAQDSESEEFFLVNS